MGAINSDKPGTGGGLRYLTEEAAPEMANQELSHSCQAACARQLLKDAGIDLSEADLLARIGYYEGIGTFAAQTAGVLSELHPNLDYKGGAVPPEESAALFARDPWIATVLTASGTTHAVIVDRLERDIVHIRDPWGLDGPGSGTGTTATMKIGDFLEHWDWAFNNAVIPFRLKGGK